MSEIVRVAGAGLAGCEAAWRLSLSGIDVELYEMRPKVFTGAHKTDSFAELVCSNSFKSIQVTNAHGLLKAEMEILGSLTMECAKKSSIPGGKALTVDREKFSGLITQAIERSEKIKIFREEVSSPEDGYWIIATGPLSSDSICGWLGKKTGEDFLYFTDAMSPVLELESIDFENCFLGSRYGFGDDYLNCPMDQKTYENFLKELAEAQSRQSHYDENVFFQGCMPVEEIARGGRESLRFGLMKPKGITDPRTGKEPYAVCQLRRESEGLKRWNMVGFQTKLRYEDQKRIFSQIPGLNNAIFIRYGQAHRNTYLNSPKVLKQGTLFLKNTKTAVSGQLSGVEGYTESAVTGILAALNVIYDLKSEKFNPPPEDTVTGGLFKHLHEQSRNFQPAAANFSIVKTNDKRYRTKNEKRLSIAENSIKSITEWSKGITF